MSSSNNSKIISKASPHTIMKFKLVEEYIKAWAQKLMLNSSCYGLVFIDCMCNSGVYTYVRLGKFVPNGMAIYYLKSGEQRKIETGIFSTIGRRKDGSIIESDTTEERAFLP